MKNVVALVVILFVASSCELFEKVSLKSESEKRIDLFTTGGVWKVDSLIQKTDVFSSGASTIISDSLFLNFGTMEFQKPNFTDPGYNTGFLIHKYSKKGVSKTDTLAWAPYNHTSGSDSHITIFYPSPNQSDFVVGAYDMYLDPLTLESKKVRLGGWRRETIAGGSGGAYGTYRRYHLTR